MVSYQPYAMGRMKFIWGDDPEEFRPERWFDRDGKLQPQSPFKFTAFQVCTNTIETKWLALEKVHNSIVYKTDGSQARPRIEFGPLVYNKIIHFNMKLRGKHSKHRGSTRGSDLLPPHAFVRGWVSIDVYDTGYDFVKGLSVTVMLVQGVLLVALCWMLQSYLFRARCLWLYARSKLLLFAFMCS